MTLLTSCEKVTMKTNSIDMIVGHMIHERVAGDFVVEKDWVRWRQSKSTTSTMTMNGPQPHQFLWST